MSDFVLHPQLKADTHWVSDLELCQVLLMNDAQYPWLILVPRLPGIREIYELSHEQRQQLWSESDRVSAVLLACFQPDKLNIAALGNMVSQLHIHHIVRYSTDAAWPAPVWGKFPPIPYTSMRLAERLSSLCEKLNT